jgi:hypothetical protein
MPAVWGGRAGRRASWRCPRLLRARAGGWAAGAGAAADADQVPRCPCSRSRPAAPRQDNIRASVGAIHAGRGSNAVPLAPAVFAAPRQEAYAPSQLLT